MTQEAEPKYRDRPASQPPRIVQPAALIYNQPVISATPILIAMTSPNR